MAAQKARGPGDEITTHAAFVVVCQAPAKAFRAVTPPVPPAPVWPSIVPALIDYDAKSWLGVVLRLRGSVGPRIAGRMLIVTAIGAAAAFLYDRHEFHTPAVVHTMIGVALGLLLVFRTNASFDRWWEGRKLLGAIVNRTRDLARQFSAYVPADSRAVVDDSMRLLNAFFALAMQGLRHERDLGVLGELLTKDERAHLEPLHTRASVVLSWITKRIDTLAREGKITDARLLAMDTNLTALVDAYSGCERIVRTPIPFAYAQHIKLFVTIFCFTVPFAIVDAMKLYTPVAAAIFAFALFGIDEIGVEIEDPFGYDDNDLPIDRIGQIIQASTTEITKPRS
jgi:putative membrane protein